MISSPPEERRPDRVREMFGAIAPRYDLLNRLLSLGFDQSWRRRAVRELPVSSEARVLDLCSGTGDVAREILTAGRAGYVVCLDFAHPMLVRAVSKLGRLLEERRAAVVEGDALRLPFGDGTFDGAMVAFGVRNFSDREAGLREVLRVLRPGGRFVVLEFSRPGGRRFARVYRAYLNRLLPRVGDGLARESGPYGYLARTIGEFPEPAILAGMLRDAGFVAAGWRPLTLGIVCVHTAIKG